MATKKEYIAIFRAIDIKSAATLGPDFFDIWMYGQSLDLADLKKRVKAERKELEMLEKEVEELRKLKKQREMAEYYGG